jgi:catalase
MAFFGGSDDSYVKKLNSGRIIHFLRESYMHQKTILLHGNAIKWGTTVGLPGEFSADVGSTGEIQLEKGVLFVPSAGIGAQMVKQLMDEMAKHRCWEREVSHIAA